MLWNVRQSIVSVEVLLNLGEGLLDGTHVGGKKGPPARRFRQRREERPVDALASFRAPAGESDGVDRDLGLLCLLDGVLHRRLTSLVHGTGVVAVGEEEERFPTVDSLELLERGEDGVVERGLALGLHRPQHAQVLPDGVREPGAETNFAVEESDAGGVSFAQVLCEEIGGGLDGAQIGTNARRGVQEKQCRDGSELGGKEGELLRNAVLQHLEAFRLQAGNETSLLVDDDDVESNRLDRHRELKRPSPAGLLLRRLARRRLRDGGTRGEGQRRDQRQ